MSIPQTLRNCPACNMPIETKQGQANNFCPNCGKHLNWSQTNAPSPEALLEKACVFMNQGSYQEAEPLIEEALTIAPQYADGYIVKLLCKLHLKNINELEHIDTPLGAYEEFQQAIRYGSKFQVMRFSKLMENNARYLEERKPLLEADRVRRCAELQKEAEELRKQISQAEKFLYANHSKKPMPKWRKILRIVEQVFMILSVSFWTLGVLFVPQLIIIDAPFVARLVFIIRRNRKEKRLPTQIQQIMQSLETNKVLLQENTEQLRDLQKSASNVPAE